MIVAHLILCLLAIYMSSSFFFFFICVSSLEKCLFRSFAHFLIGLFVFLVLTCMSCLCIFEINPLSIVSLAITFSHSEGCLFTLFIVSFAVQKLLSLIRSHFFCFCFYFHYSRRQVIEDPAVILCRRVFCLFSSRSFIVSSLIFRALIHFEFTFVYVVRKCSNFILLHVAFQFSQHYPLHILASFVKNKVLMGARVYLWVFSLIPLVCISVLCQHHAVLMTVALQCLLKSGRGFLQLQPSLSGLLWLFWVFCVSI